MRVRGVLWKRERARERANGRVLGRENLLYSSRQRTGNENLALLCIQGFGGSSLENYDNTWSSILMHITSIYTMFYLFATCEDIEIQPSPTHLPMVSDA